MVKKQGRNKTKGKGRRVRVFDVEVPRRDSEKFLVVFPNGDSKWFARYLIKENRVELAVIDGKNSITLDATSLPEYVEHECEVHTID
tara:strand:+ start:25654 stop:25914 length:261 start_codon:yes stop_codon:yes gene_type:complete